MLSWDFRIIIRPVYCVTFDYKRLITIIQNDSCIKIFNLAPNFRTIFVLTVVIIFIYQAILIKPVNTFRNF